MSYRTSIDGVQIFGNNDYYEEYIQFLKQNGVVVDEEGCYDAEIDDIMGLFAVIDKITRKLIKEQHERVLNKETNYKGEYLRELTDFSNHTYLNDKIPILFFNQDIIENAYCFLPYQVYIILKDKLERVYESYNGDAISWDFCTYKLKDGEKISVSAG